MTHGRYKNLRVPFGNAACAGGNHAMNGILPIGLEHALEILYYSSLVS